MHFKLRQEKLFNLEKSNTWTTETSPQINFWQNTGANFTPTKTENLAQVND